LRNWRLFCKLHSFSFGLAINAARIKDVNHFFLLLNLPSLFGLFHHNFIHPEKQSGVVSYWKIRGNATKVTFLKKAKALDTKGVV